MAFITDTQLAADNGSSLVGHIADDANAQPRTAQEKLRDWVNVLDFHDPNDGTDLTDALETLIYEAFPSIDDMLYIQLPMGNWTVTRQIIPGRPVYIAGAGIYGTILAFDLSTANATMKGAFSLGNDAALTAYDPDYGNKVQGAAGADFSTFENLQIQLADDQPSGLDYGLWSCARLFARNVLCLKGGFKLVAGELMSTYPAHDMIAGNANVSELHNCHSLLATEHGFVFDGTDANACKIEGCNAFSPTGYGYYDASFLGNAYTGCHASAPVTSYKVALGVGANRSVFTGCYAEQAAAPDPNPALRTEWDVPTPATIVGPVGTLPYATGAGKNAALAGHFAAGFITGSQVIVTDNMNNSFGSSSIPASQFFGGGVYVRGQGGNGDIYQLVSKGQEWGGDPGYGSGVSIVKRGGVSGTNYQLIHLGDARNKPAFPRGIAATLPAYANDAAAITAGLTSGDFYRKTTTGTTTVCVVP